MIKGIAYLLAIFPLATLASCAPADIPSKASTHWSLKDGFFWTWRRPADGGCVLWMATEDWARVQAVIDMPCGLASETAYAEGKGLTYISFADNLVFNGYWPWSSDIFNGRTVYDGDGMIANILPCPYSLSADQVAKMQPVIRVAESNATTPGERRVLSRIAERLALVDGEALSSSQEGCMDEVRNNDRAKPRQRIDPWSAS